jgi:erythromycin esterase-like protein
MSELLSRRALAEAGLAVAGLAALGADALAASRPATGTEMTMPEADRAWVRKATVPLRTLDPNDTDYADLEPLRRIVGNARVVSIGESAHQLHESYQLRHRVARFLISELGFDAFVMESGFPEGLAVHDWVRGGPGSVESVANTGITYGFGEPTEVREQLTWLRQWNATHERKVDFYGMDISGSGVNVRPAIEACLSRLPPQPGDRRLLELADPGPRLRDAMARYLAMSPEDKTLLSSGIAELANRAHAARDEVALRCAACAQAFAFHTKNMAVAEQVPNSNPRDELMADNVRWILDKHQRIVIGAHNGHIARWPLKLGPMKYPQPMLGQFLAETLGPEMVVIGTTYASGRVGKIVLGGANLTEMQFHYENLPPPPEHSIDALMDSAGLPVHMLDLRNVPAERLSEATSQLIFHDSVDINVKVAYDALIHIHKVEPVAGEPGPVYLG